MDDLDVRLRERLDELSRAVPDRVTAALAPQPKRRSPMPPDLPGSPALSLAAIVVLVLLASLVGLLILGGEISGVLNTVGGSV